MHYDAGLGAMAEDPIFDQPWRDWVLTVRRQVGLVELADMIYVRSEHYQQDNQQDASSKLALFGEKEGRIALANRKKDPLLLFAALQRQLGYPQVPRPWVGPTRPVKAHGTGKPPVRLTEAISRKLCPHHLRSE